MFNPDATTMVTVEIREAEEMRKRAHAGVNQVIREYTGRWYSEYDGASAATGVPDRDTNPEPYSYSYVSNILPALIFDNPACTVQARRVMGHRLVAKAMSSGLKYWMIDVAYKAEVEKVVLDFLFYPEGVLMHFIEDDTRWSAGAVRPNVKRIDPRKFLKDPAASSIEDAEWLGHEYEVDLDDLQTDPALKPEARDKIQVYGQDDRTRDEPFKKGNPSALKRKVVCVYSVWQRRTNTIRVFVKHPTPLEIYEPREYYGPPTGPYTLFRAYPVPSQTNSLSPLLAVQEQVQDLQVHGRAAARSAAGRKSVVIVDGTQANLGDDLKNAADREVLSVPGFSSSQAVQLEFGGVEPKQYEYLNFLRDRLDRHGGLTETARGQSQSNTTATESQIASEAFNNRTEYLKGRVRDGVACSLKAIGWMLFHTAGIIIPVNDRDPVTGIETEGLFFGGPIPQQDTGSWDDYSIKIEPYSMQRVSEQVVQRRAMDTANLVMQMAPMMPQIPWVQWMEVMRMVLESINQEDPDRFFNMQMLNMMGMMGQPPLTPASAWTGPGPEKPRYFSQPGYGYKPPPGQATQGDQYQPAVYDRRQEFGAQYGGTQGPPGSASYA